MVSDVVKGVGLAVVGGIAVAVLTGGGGSGSVIERVQRQTKEVEETVKAATGPSMPEPTKQSLTKWLGQTPSGGPPGIATGGTGSGVSSRDIDLRTGTAAGQPEPGPSADAESSFRRLRESVTAVGTSGEPETAGGARDIVIDTDPTDEARTAPAAPDFTDDVISDQESVANLM